MPLTAALAGAALACSAAPADAADARVSVSIPPKGYADALIDLGVQANVSVIGTSACGRGGRVSLKGAFDLDAAFTRLLEGAPCRHRIIDSRTVRILALERAAPATSKPPPPPTFVAELVVTATKRPASSDRIAAAVTAIPREQLEQTGAADVGQTVGLAAGLLTTNLGPGRDKLLIRALSDGAFTGRARSTVSTYLDDAPINYNAPDPDLRLVDVERIEVIRGPQGALYGSGAIAGVYRIVTAKPDLERFLAGVEVTASSTKGGDPSGVAQGYVNLPLGAGAAGLRIAAYTERAGGYLDDLLGRADNLDRTIRRGGRAALRLRLSDAWTVDLLSATQHLRTKDAQYVVPAGKRAAEFRESHDNDFSHAALSVRGDLGAATLESTTAYVHHTFTSQYDASEAVDIFAAPPTDVGVYLENTRVNMLVEDLVLRSQGAGRFGWLVGAYGALTLDRSPSMAQLVSARGVGRTVYQELRKDRLEELALYGEGFGEVAPGWTLGLGGRYFHTRVRTSADLSVQSPPGMSRRVRAVRQFDGFSPKISLQRELSSGDLVYALLSEGYRPGGFNTAGVQAPRNDRSSYTPDRLRNFEVGGKFRLLEDRLTIRTAAYWNLWRRIQTDQYRPSGLAYTANVGDGRITGIEAEVGYDWSDSLSLQATALYSDSRITNKNPAFVATRITDRLPGVPKFSGGVLAAYHRPLAGALTLRLSGEANYVGRSGVSFDSIVTSKMGDYVRARLQAEIAARRWRAAVFVSNPLNDAGNTFAYGNPFSLGSRLRAVPGAPTASFQVTPQRPRTFGLRLGATF